MRWLRRLIGIALVVGLLIGWTKFQRLHDDPVTLHYYFGSTATTSWVALVGAFGVGFAVAALLGLLQLARVGLMARRYRKTVRGLEREVDELRKQPLTEEVAPAVPAVAPGAGDAARSA